MASQDTFVARLGASIAQFFSKRSSGYAPVLLVKGGFQLKALEPSIRLRWKGKDHFRVIKRRDNESMWQFVQRLASTEQAGINKLAQPTSTLMLDPSAYASWEYSKINQFIDSIKNAGSKIKTIIDLGYISDLSETERYFIKDVYWMLATDTKQKQCLLVCQIDPADERTSDSFCRDLDLLPVSCQPMIFDQPDGEPVTETRPVEFGEGDISLSYSEVATRWHQALDQERHASIIETLNVVLALADSLLTKASSPKKLQREDSALIFCIAARLARYGKLDRARRLLEARFGFARDTHGEWTKSRWLKRKVLELLIDVYRLQGNLDDAIEVGKLALEDLGESDSASTKRSLNTRVALSLLHSGRTSEAKSLLESNCFFNQEVDRWHVARNIVFGHLCNAEGDYQRARAAYEQAIMAAIAIHYVAGEAAARQSLAILLSETGQIEAAPAEFTQAIRCFDGCNNIIGAQAARHSFARIKMRLGQVDEAADELSQCIRFFLHVRSQRDLCTALVDIAEAFTKKGQFDQAIDRLRQAIIISDQCGYTDIVAAARLCLFKNEFAKGCANDARFNLAEAKKHYQLIGKSNRNIEMDQCQDAIDAFEFDGVIGLRRWLRTVQKNVQSEGNKTASLILNDLISVAKSLCRAKRKSTTSQFSQPKSEQTYQQIDAELIGSSANFQALMNDVDVYAPAELTVLVHGESGVGKELVVRQIHAKSLRSDKPLVILDGASISEEMFDAQCFGFVKGAFTGATSHSEGLIAAADGGTLFIDNLDLTSLESQAKLLRVIQEREYRRVGSNESLKVDIRIIVAFSRPVDAVLESDSIRHDLFYRVGGCQIAVPSLRERKQDISELADYFLDQTIKEASGLPENDESLPQLKWHSLALKALVAYGWPGNVRELKNECHRIASSRLQTDNWEPINWVELSGKIRHPLPVKRNSKATNIGEGGLNAALVALERDLIEQTLQETEGNVSAAARALGLCRSSLRERIKRLKISS